MELALGLRSAGAAQVCKGGIGLLVEYAVFASSGRIAEPDTETVAHDRADLPAAQNGDSGAYARIVARHEAAIGKQMWRFTRDTSTHAELVQDVFVEAYFSLASFRGESPLEHWMRRIATRVGYRHWKARAKSAKRPLISLSDLPGVDLTEQMPARDAADALFELLAHLPSRDRLVLTLLHWEGCSIAEAARQTGWTQVMVKVQAFRARRKLKALWERSQ